MYGGGKLYVGYLGPDGRELVPRKYSWGGHFREGLARVQCGKSWGYIDETGKEVVPCVHDKTYPVIRGRGLVRNLEHGNHFVDTKGQFIEWANTNVHAKWFEEFRKLDGEGLSKSGG